MRSFSEQSSNSSGPPPSERRSHARKNLAALTYVTIGDNNGGIISNVSESGMAFTAAEPVAEKVVPRLIFEIPGINRTVEIQAQIIWIAESKKAAGVHFINVPDEVRAQIGDWVFSRPPKSRPGARSRSSLSEELAAPAMLTTPATPAKPTISRQPVSKSRPPQQSRAPEQQTDDFDRMFPSEHEPQTFTREDDRAHQRAVSWESTVAPDAEEVFGRREEPYENPRGVEATSQRTQPRSTPFSVLGIEQTRQTTNSEPRVPETPAREATPYRPPPLPAIFQPAIDQSFSRMLESQATPFFGEPPASKWWLVAVAVTVCFMLGFAIQPGFLHELPGMGNVRDRLFGSSGKTQTAEHDVSSAPQTPADASRSNPPTNIAAETNAEAPAPNTNTPSVPGAQSSHDARSDGTAINDSGKNANTSPARSSPYPTKSVGSSQSADSMTELAMAERRREMGEATYAIKPEVDPELSQGSSVKSVGQSPNGSMLSPNGEGVSSPVASGTPTAAPATVNPPAVSPSAGSSATTLPSTTASPAGANTAAPSATGISAAPPPARTSMPALRSTPPPSFFPVVAPAAGNVPRLMLLPEERVIDTAMVKIHTHQFVFIPAQPGPESSHQPERLQIGERITKVAPTYPPEAQQKGMGGTVQLRATISADGAVENVKPLHGPDLFIPAAVDAVRQWRYRPTLLDRQPIVLQEDFTIEFRPLGTQYRE
jgi:TonB family protein